MAFLSGNAATDATITTNAKIARDVYEAAAIIAARAADTNQFVRNVKLLRPYYAAVNVIGESDLRLPITGLYLLYLLAAEDLAEFHIELEMLSESDALSQDIASVADLERAIAEGNYHKALSMRGVVPLASLNIPFFGLIEESVRKRVLECCAVSYSSLTLPRITRLLAMPNDSETAKFVAKVGYQVGPGQTVYFQGPSPDDMTAIGVAAAAAADQKAPVHAVPAHLLISQMISNATDIERIV